MARPTTDDMNRLIQRVDEQLTIAVSHMGGGRWDQARFHQMDALVHAVLGVMREVHGLRSDLADKSDA